MSDENSVPELKSVEVPTLQEQIAAKHDAKPNGHDKAAEREVPAIIRLAAVERFAVSLAAALLKTHGVQSYQAAELAQEWYSGAETATEAFDKAVFARVGDGWADVADRLKKN